MIDIRHLTNLKHRLAAEGGFVLIAAIAVLSIMLVLTTAAIAVSVDASKSTTHDTNSKTALAVAEAGMQVAEYRLKEFSPAKGECTGKEVEESPGEGKDYCQSSGPESLGNNATFTYQTTRELTAGEKCAGEKASEAGERCVTVKGEVNGVTQRLQTLVKSPVPQKLFSIEGILGLNEVKVAGSDKATAVVASNEKIIGEGSADFEKGYELCPPKGSFKPAIPNERNSSGVTVGDVTGGYVGDPSLEKTRSASECPLKAEISKEAKAHATSSENEDIRISDKEDPKSEGYWPVPPITGEEPQYSGPPKYELTVGSGNSQLTLGGSKYYFCKLTIDGDLKIAAGHKVEIFIGSHEENANCPSGSGEFKVEGAGHLENPNGAGDLLIEVAGKGPVEIGNSGTVTASIFAPEAEVALSGAGSLTGAIVGKEVHLIEGSFIYSSSSGALTVSSASTGSYERKAWDQCTSSTTATPEEGC